ncbi:predicted protein [Naegleria gruberi]|uniref:Predicted protein n=1 Tax=Naegleria gruberi TaxID=5762 RepID=D2VT88_NAEGR|nr:uncharacterized protein NAEGRDRAFT_72214 [Naegleria gruberi]EFC40041.1 predicted protein [Naegleria gruberi]|eukprot:XP_002672785.1 predicted protein [Naegleria gruberi strain NEG-M]
MYPQHSDMMIISSNCCSSSSSNNSNTLTLSTTSSCKNSILGDLPVYNSKNFSNPNPRSNLNPPKLIFNHSKPKQIVTTERISLLQRSFEKLNQHSNNNTSNNNSNNNNNNNNNLKRGNDLTNLNEKPTKLLKYN